MTALSDWAVLVCVGVGGVLCVAVFAYAVMAVSLANRFTLPKRVEGFSGTSQATLDYRTVRFYSRNNPVPLSAWYWPAPRPEGAVIFVHGRNASKGNELNSEALSLARRLVESGLSVMLLDLRGHGDSGSARMTYGVNERLDVLGAVDFLVREGHAPGKIGVLGASMGGAAAIAAAAEEPSIAAVVCDSAFADFGQLLRHQFPRLLPMGQFFLPGTLLMARLKTGVSLHRFKPAELAKQLSSRNLLVIHASGDLLVSVDHAHAIATGTNAELWITDADSHVASFSRQPREYSDRVTTFFVGNLVGSKSPSSRPRAGAPVVNCKAVEEDPLMRQAA